jgi:hypothetical protein
VGSAGVWSGGSGLVTGGFVGSGLDVGLGQSEGLEEEGRACCAYATRGCGLGQ